MSPKEFSCLIDKLSTLVGGSEDGGGLHLAADAREATLFHLDLTLGAGVKATLPIPTAARGFRLTTALSDVVFAIDEDPATGVATSASATPLESAYGVGNVASGTEREVRLSFGSELRIESATGGTVLVEFFG